MGKSNKPGGGLHYFSDEERPKQEGFAQLRTRVLGPILKPLRGLGVTADHFTLAGVLCYIPYAYFFNDHPRLASILIWVAVLVDGLDGVYARATNTVTRGGALADVFADHAGMVITCLLIIRHDPPLADPTLAAYYAIIYVVMIALSVGQNFLGLPMQLILRSKYLLYGAVMVWAWWDYTPIFTWLMGFFSLTMSLNAFHSFVRIKRHLEAQDSEALEPENPEEKD